MKRYGPKSMHGPHHFFSSMTSTLAGGIRSFWKKSLVTQKMLFASPRHKGQHVSPIDGRQLDLQDIYSTGRQPLPEFS
ncbi:hypothetical protein HanHA300_Chr15g0584411 [Helianthus annuus]|nr:hypothetical protein HanHA300_Chr15g0584411 [Helianthus annuus]KAJ0474830.1 hypothetical protein HanHA89_Chr15g0634201 [Helianthus annuus]KAJ0650385.1 hypothetical protein HanLR1_Chr15g0595121 [Helianthus annuus]KAJ0654150.1 hypothetical protein HanOQP8_Chr15g0591661 [Helianthus annuus]